jgi:hypothetical protein
MVRVFLFLVVTCFDSFTNFQIILRKLPWFNQKTVFLRAISKYIYCKLIYYLWNLGLKVILLMNYIRITG